MADRNSNHGHWQGRSTISVRFVTNRVLALRRGVQEPFLSGGEYSPPDFFVWGGLPPRPLNPPPILGGSGLKNKTSKSQKFHPILGGSRSEIFKSLPPRFFKSPPHSGGESLLPSNVSILLASNAKNTPKISRAFGAQIPPKIPYFVTSKSPKFSAPAAGY